MLPLSAPVRRILLGALGLCLLAPLPPTTAQAPAGGKGPDLIPRKALFGNPDRANVQLSPDGKQLSFLAPSDGVLNVWVAPADRPEAARVVTKDKKRGLTSYLWAYTNQHIFYVQDNDGDEDYHLYRVELKTGDIKDMTPVKGVRAQPQVVSHRHPEEIVFGLNDRDPKYHDLYRLNVLTGAKTLLQKNTGFLAFTVDDDYKVRFGMKLTGDGSALYLTPDGKDGWTEFMKVPMADSLTTAPVGFDRTGTVAYLQDSRGRDTAALTTLDLKSNKQTVLAEDRRADVGKVMLHPTENTVQAVSFTFDKQRWEFKDPAVKADFEELKKVAAGEVVVTSRTLDDRTWLVALTLDNGPVRYYHYDRAAKKARFLFTNQKSLEGLPLQKMHPHVVKSRDGLDLVCYLTLPAGSDPKGAGRPDSPVPTVLLVHGGPWGRDNWGYNPLHQLLANRGYAVLSVNFRGSTGFGKNFLNAANKEWAGKMHDDLLDAVNWAVKEKVADPKKVAIMGGSYGGYATLVGLTFTPEVFACGVDIVGPSNLVTLLKTVPPYWAPAVQMFKDRVGDHTTEAGMKELTARSPLTHADKIKRPLLIGQGANDPRVKQAESDQIVQAMESKKIPVTYVLYPDEGHGFQRPANKLSFWAVTEAFLARHLGGRYQPVGGDFEGSSLLVPVGAEGVPGLAENLPGKDKGNKK